MNTLPDPPSLSGMAVLVVEDEYFLAAELTDQIACAGGSVIGPFATADDALTALADATADCALVDINTGDGPSFTLADVLLARGTPFVFLTGYDAGVVPERFGAVERVQKPAPDSAVIAALAKLRRG